MVSIPGHAYCEGKATSSAQARCVNLARRGVIAMAYDYIGIGERNTGAAACAAMPYGGGNDHGLPQFSYTAGTPTGLEILDAVRAIDYLLTRPDVDRNRLGFTGESGGGNSTYWVSALDERVRLAVPVSSVTTFDYWIRNDRNWDWHQRPHGVRRIADIPTLLQMIAPRPLLVISSRRGTDSEEFPVEEAEEAVKQARVAYDLYGADTSLESWESGTDHGYQQDKRERMYAFVEKHFLAGGSDSSAESPFLLESMKGLACGLPNGNRTLADIYGEWLAVPTPQPELPSGPAAAEQVQAEWRRKLGALLGIEGDGAPAGARLEAVTSRGDAVLRRWILEPEPGIRLPLVELTPRTAPAKGIVIVPGKTEHAAARAGEFLSLRIGVALVDPRGTGEIDPGGRRTSNWAWFAGKPWPGMWAMDICAAARALSREHAGTRIGIAGLGEFAKASLFAAALCPEIRACFAQLVDATYRDESAKGNVADVPRVLGTMDLPAVLALIAPRRCLIEHPPAAAGTFRQAFGWSKEFSSRGFNINAIEIRTAPGENWKSVASWFLETGLQ
jgi:hypothetical protein